MKCTLLEYFQNKFETMKIMRLNTKPFIVNADGGTDFYPPSKLKKRQKKKNYFQFFRIFQEVKKTFLPFEVCDLNFVFFCCFFSLRGNEKHANKTIFWTILKIEKQQILDICLKCLYNVFKMRKHPKYFCLSKIRL